MSGPALFMLIASQTTPILRLDIASFEQTRHTDPLRQETSQLDIRTDLLHRPAITVTTTLNIVGSLRHRDPTVQLSLEWKLLLVVLPWVLPFQTAVFGIAWWTTFREKRSTRAWGMQQLLAVQE